jgi:oleandomycin transport system ATP-binding protein
MTDAIRAEGLVKTFGEQIALDGVDLAVRPGTVLGLLGPNGAGKTTAVRVFATLIRPDDGVVTVGGYDAVREPEKVRRLIGLTGQYAAIDEELTGTENLVLIARLLRLSRAAARARADQLIEVFDLVDAAGRVAKTYSGGMRRRLDLAASLVGQPTVLFLDEPTTGLDPRSRTEVWRMVGQLVADGTTVLLTTQQLDEADRLATEIAVLDHGRVIASGTPAQLKAKVAGRSLDVRAADAADTATVRAVLRDIVGEPAPATAEDPTLVSVAVDDAGCLPAVTNRLHAEGVEVQEFSLRSASLDEVFLTLTGHPSGNQEQA